MSKEKIVCKIYVRDPATSTVTQIIGQVAKAQLFSPFNSFIEVENETNRVICKKDIKELVIYKAQNRIVITKERLEVNYPLQIES